MGGKLWELGGITMSNQDDFSELLDQYIKQAGRTVKWLAKQSQIPEETIKNWRRGRTKKPRHWRDVLELAKALRLNLAEATKLLQSIGRLALTELWKQAKQSEDNGLLDLLTPWGNNLRKQLEDAPFQAPPELLSFVGREEATETLKTALQHEVKSSNHNLRIYTIQGMAGVGKTTLAVRLAYQLRPDFGDGVLWARLTPDSDPMTVLNQFAEAYGQDVSKYTDLNSRSSMVRGILADKQALIVLDDVQSSEQVKPLLPPNGKCAVIITTRHHDLLVTYRGTRLDLEPFDKAKEESLALFKEQFKYSRYLKVEDVQQEKATFAEIADLLGHLPLAVEIASSRMAIQPGWTATRFLSRLRREKQRLHELSFDNLNVRLSFNLSYDALPPVQQPFFASLALFGSEDFGVEAVAYVSNTSQDEAHDHFWALYGLSLVQEGRQPGRYRLHPLWRDYAREKWESAPLLHEGELARMVEFFVDDVERHSGMQEENVNNMKLESSNMLAALQAAFEQGMQAALVRGTNAFSPFLLSRGLYRQASMLLTRAEEAASALDEPIGLITTWKNLGEVAEKLGNYTQAEEYLQKGLLLARPLGDGERIGILVASLGLAEWVSWEV